MNDQFITLDGVTESTMMGTSCLRYRDEFVAMYFEKEESLIVKLDSGRVTQLTNDGLANEFNFTRKRFKEWALIPLEHQGEYLAYVEEAIEFARSKKSTS
ncbi:MAG: hypothetical protein ABJD02_01005 [Paraglaciecola sp.]|uniref:hypothetical protein n=1 Tax=Paraglaciecola sp. TaxID=1920173 RepID=UPI0032666ADA